MGDEKNDYDEIAERLGGVLQASAGVGPDQWQISRCVCTDSLRSLRGGDERVEPTAELVQWPGRVTQSI